MNERFDAIVGDLKWWFRSAAPPELIFLMRTLHGLAVMLERLDAKLPWKFLLEKLCYDQFSARAGSQTAAIRDVRNRVQRHCPLSAGVCGQAER